MKIEQALILSVLAGTMLLPAGSRAAESSRETPQARVRSQPGTASEAPRIEGQGGSASTLEIAPQPGARAPGGTVEEIPGDRSFIPSDEGASLDRGFVPETENSLANREDDLGKPRGAKPYLGIDVKYTTRCYLGMEEHGLEVLKIDPDSPAAVAGLKGPTRSKALGAAAVTAGSLLGPVGLLLNPLLEKSGALGMEGDLIVAVDDVRVRSRRELDEAMARLKPGDTMYLTVIRPLPGGQHKTMKIAVKVGKVGERVAKAEPAPEPKGGGGGESYVH